MSTSTTSTLSTLSPSTSTTTNLDTLYILQKRASTAFLTAEARATTLATELSRRSTLLENQDWKLQRLSLKLRENHTPNEEETARLEEEFKLAVELYMELCNECNEAEVALMEAERESRRRREEVKRAEERCIRAVWRRSGVGVEGGG